MAYNASDENKLFESGEYEGTLIKADVKSYQTGTQYLNLCFSLDGGCVYKKVLRDKVETTKWNKRTIGGLLGAFLLSKISSKWLVVIFSVIMIFAGGKMLFF